MDSPPQEGGDISSSAEESLSRGPLAVPGTATVNWPRCRQCCPGTWGSSPLGLWSAGPANPPHGPEGTVTHCYDPESHSPASPFLGFSSGHHQLLCPNETLKEPHSARHISHRHPFNQCLSQNDMNREFLPGEHGTGRCCSLPGRG